MGKFEKKYKFKPKLNQEVYCLSYNLETCMAEVSSKLYDGTNKALTYYKTEEEAYIALKERYSHPWWES